MRFKNAKMSTCPICNKKFESGDLSNEFTIHVNVCLDEQEHEKIIPKNFHVGDEKRLHPLMKKQREKRLATDCVVCGKPKVTAAHIKKCGKQYNVNTDQLVKLVGKSEQEKNNNLNLQNIKFKDSTLDKRKIVNNLFTDDDLVGLPSTNQEPQPSPDLSIVVDHNDLSKNGTQTKLKIVRKSKNSKLPADFAEDRPLHACKSKIRKTVKVKRNPLVKLNLDNMIIQNFKNEFVYEKELPISWKLANLNYDSSYYTVEGFEEFCQSFDYKEKMNGFEI